MPITQHAGIRQVVRRGRSAVLPADKMIDLVREAGVVFIDQTVFAALSRAGLLRPGVPCEYHSARARIWRALALAILRMCSSSMKWSSSAFSSDDKRPLFPR